MYLLLILILGIVWIPSIAFACGSASEKSCCKKDKSVKDLDKKIKDCCKKDKKHPNDKEDCGGKCGKTSCHCPLLHPSLLLPSIPEISYKNFVSLLEKQKFSYIKTYLSLGFYSIWIPPNRR